MRLRIKDLIPSDFGSYICVAKNSLGETRGSIRIYEIPKSKVEVDKNSQHNNKNNNNKYFTDGLKSSHGNKDKDGKISLSLSPSLST